MTTDQSPTQEAISIVTIAAVLVGVCSYAGAMDNLPVVTPAMAWLVNQLGPVMPTLFQTNQLLVASAAVGLLVWIIGLAFCGSIANWFSQSQIGAIDRQTERLKRNRDRITRARRAKDDFDVV